MLDTSTKLEGTTSTISLTGRLDTMTAFDFEKELKTVIEKSDKLILNFADLDYISSAGLRVILSAQKEMAKKGGLVIRNVKPEVNEIFEVTGFSGILTIE